MQSGHADADRWVIEHPQAGGIADPLMGRSGARPTRTQVHLQFETREAAVGYAERNGLAYVVLEPAPIRLMRGKSYSDNFACGRKAPWTH